MPYNKNIFAPAHYTAPATATASDYQGRFLALLVFLLIFAGFIWASNTLSQKEDQNIRLYIETEATKVEQLLHNQANDKILALNRMASRWIAADETPEKVWKVDAANYITQLAGLRTIEWIDNTYHVRWVEPAKGNEDAIGSDILFDKEREDALKDAVEKDQPTLTPPMLLPQGYNAFIAFMPLKINGRFDGFIAGLFSVEEFFGKAIKNETKNRFSVAISYNGKVYFSNGASGKAAHPDVPSADDDFFESEPHKASTENEYDIHKSIRLYDKAWQLHISPTQELIKSQRSLLPQVLSITGLIIGLLAAMATLLIMSSRGAAKNLIRLNQHISEKETRYSLAINGMSVGVWDWTIETNVVFWSQRFKEIIGHTSDSATMTYEDFLIWLHPEDKERVSAALASHLYQQVPYDTEYRLRHADGHYVWIRATGKAVWDENGQPLYMAGSVDDISARKAAEIKLETARQFQNLVLETIPSYLFVKDENFNIVRANPAFLSLYPPEVRPTIIGTTTLEGYRKDEAEEFLKMDRETFASGFTRYEEKITFPDGRIRDIQTVKVRFQDTEGKRFILGVSDDISLRKESERQRNSLLEKLSESNVELERFAYVASHDMQEPLRMITNFSKIIANDYSGILDETGREYLDLMNNAGLRMQAMINDLLEFARVNKEHPGVTQVDGEKELSVVLQSLSSLIQDKQARITHDPLPVFNGNPLQFSRLLQNLITNGIKYQPPANIPQIHIGVKQTPHEWTFSVADNGLGIDEKFLTKVFQPFRRLHNWTDIKGTGIGLAICEKIVKNFGGKIWVTSEKGKGSVFHFTLPKTNASNLGRTDHE